MFKESEINKNIIATANHDANSHYNKALWIGIVISVNEEQKDCEIKNIHPSNISQVWMIFGSHCFTKLLES